LAKKVTPFFTRSAQERDVDTITKIYADAVLNGTASYELEPPSRVGMAERVAFFSERGFPFLVADTGKKVLGYAYASPFRPRPAYRFVVENSVYVAPSAKGRGVGRALMLELISRCEGLGFHQMIAVIGDGKPDSPSVILHEKLGFRHAGRLEGSGYKHDRWLDTVFMQFSMNGGNAEPPDPASMPEEKFRTNRNRQ
jgi:phosphinothricin acetyltransferase